MMNFTKIREGDLEDFVTGYASPEVITAIENSPEYRQKAAEFGQIDQFLSALFTEVKPLNPQYLVDVASGQASASQRVIVAAHCRHDPEVQAELETLEASWKKMVAV